MIETISPSVDPSIWVEDEPEKKGHLPVVIPPFHPPTQTPRPRFPGVNFSRNLNVESLATPPLNIPIIRFPDRMSFDFGMRSPTILFPPRIDPIYHGIDHRAESFVEIYEKLQSPIWKVVLFIPYKIKQICDFYSKDSSVISVLCFFMVDIPMISFFFPITTVTAIPWSIWEMCKWVFSCFEMKK